MSQRLQYTGHPNDHSLRAWEPFDTMVSPARFFNAVSQVTPPSATTVVEPWTEEGLEAPMARAVLGYITHPVLRGGVSLRIGEHFITRVSFLSDKPPPRIQLGKPSWDDHVVTHASSPEYARSILTRALRGLLRQWAFSGHLEMKRGGIICHSAACEPTAAGYDQMARALQQLLQAALTPDH